MNYTSPSPANVGLNGNQTTWWIPARNLSAYTATNVIVTVTVSPSAGLAPVTYVADTGTFNFTTGKWTVGTLAPGAVKWLKIVTSVTDIGLAPFTITSVISGDGIDPNNVNNTYTQTINSVNCTPVAGANDDLNKCACINVAENDQPCSYGTSEWRLNEESVTNSVSYTWDQTTGKGNFTFINPTVPITGAYTLWCDPGTGFVETSGPAIFTISPIIENIDVFNHTTGQIKGEDLTAEQIAILSEFVFDNNTLPEDQIIKYCWNLIYNADGDIVGGWPYDCNEKQDTRHFNYCSDVNCDATESPCVNCPQSELPSDVFDYILTVEDYTPENGDTITVQHPDAVSYYTYDDGWKRNSCGCVYKISQDEGNLLELGSDNAPYFNGNTSVETDSTLDGDGVAPNVLKIAQQGAVNGQALVWNGTTWVPGNSTGDNWGTQVIQHDADSISSGNGTSADPLLVPAPCPDINLELTPGLQDTTTILKLYVDGIDNTHPAWDTWVWQTSAGWFDPLYNATWVDYPTVGNDTFGISADDTNVRVKLTYNGCTYYSNVSGIERETYQASIAITGSKVGELSRLFTNNQIASWKWQTTPYVGGVFTTPTVWTDVQTAGNTYTIPSGVGLRVSATVNNTWGGTTTIYSNVITPYQESCPLWMALSGNWIQYLYYEGFDATLTTHVWQKYGGSNSWVDVQVGGITMDPDSLSLLAPVGDGDTIRVKYLNPTTGCTVYSPINFVFGV